VAAAARPALLAAAPADSHWPRLEGSDTPKLALELTESGPVATSPGMRPMGNVAAGGLDEASMRRVKQLGVTHVLMGGPPIPWKETDLRARVDKLKAGGLTLGNLMIGGFPNTIYGKAGRDEEIEKVRQSIRAAGRAGVPVVEYNFYAHRLVEGYFEETGRAGAGLTAFDYERVKNLPPLPAEGAHQVDEIWKNIA
jgi:mannonate dehydratase